MLPHLLFECLAWVAAIVVAKVIARLHYLPTRSRSLTTNPGYFIALGLGAILGAVLLGSANMTLAGIGQLGHSIAGAIAGGIIAVETFKFARGERGSTGNQFVAPLALGIAIGRLGCFYAGLPDFTYGTPTDLPWGVDFGDGIRRHPVQLYEASAMFLFLGTYLRALSVGSPLFQRQGFYLFIGWYGLQRFFWEFLKPYPKVAGPFNIFQVSCVAMLAYSLIMMRRNDDVRAAI